MPTSKDSPTAGEVAADVRGSSTQQPEINDGVQASDAVTIDQPANSDPLQNDDYNRQNPPAPDPDAESVPDEELLVEAADEQAEVEPGDIWVKYTGSTIHHRGLTLKDQTDMGVPEDRTMNNALDVSPSNLEGAPLEPGLWWGPRNRHRVNVTGAHPALLVYLEEDDDNFEVTRY